MNIYQQSSEDYDRIVHRILYGADAPGADSPPAYSDDEEVILEAIKRVFGEVALVWKREQGRRGRQPGATVCIQGTDGGSECYGGTRAETLCDAAIKLTALRAPRRTPVDVETGFYWFRPTPYLPVHPVDVSCDGETHQTTIAPFVFISDEPMPVFVHEVEGRWLVTGMANLIDWPRHLRAGGWSAIALDELPGELGPQLEAPAAWGGGRHPERLMVEPMSYDSAEHPVYDYVDVWTGKRMP